MLHGDGKKKIINKTIFFMAPNHTLRSSMIVYVTDLRLDYYPVTIRVGLADKESPARTESISCDKHFIKCWQRSCFYNTSYDKAV